MSQLYIVKVIAFINFHTNNICLVCCMICPYDRKNIDKTDYDSMTTTFHCFDS